MNYKWRTTNAPSVNTLLTENIINWSKQRDEAKNKTCIKNHLKKETRYEVWVIDAYALVKENHINISPEW